MKYIMIEALEAKLPILFPDVLVHKFVAKSVTDMLRRQHGWDAKVISAGTVSLRVGKVCTFGMSETLKVPAAADDAQIISMIFGR